jgi:hypothetical protein
VLIKVAQYLSFYVINFVKFVFILQENISAKENNQKLKVKLYLYMYYLNKPVKHIYTLYIHLKQSFKSFTIDNILKIFL